MQYFNAKKVVIDSNFESNSIESQYQPKIKGTIDYLPTDKMWEFGRANLNLNTNTSTVHVPTNIYDKCELYFICCSFLTVTTPPPLPPLSPPLPKEKVRSGIISRKDNCNSHCLESDYICNFGGNSTGICQDAVLNWGL